MSPQQISNLRDRIQTAYECRDWEQYAALLDELAQARAEAGQ